MTPNLRPAHRARYLQARNLSWSVFSTSRNRSMKYIWYPERNLLDLGKYQDYCQLPRSCNLQNLWKSSNLFERMNHHPNSNLSKTLPTGDRPTFPVRLKLYRSRTNLKSLSLPPRVHTFPKPFLQGARKLDSYFPFRFVGDMRDRLIWRIWWKKAWWRKLEAWGTGTLKHSQLSCNSRLVSWSFSYSVLFLSVFIPKGKAKTRFWTPFHLISFHIFLSFARHPYPKELAAFKLHTWVASSPGPQEAFYNHQMKMKHRHCITSQPPRVPLHNQVGSGAKVGRKRKV